MIQNAIRKLMKRAIKCILNHKNPIRIDNDGDAKSILDFFKYNLLI